MLRLYRTSLSRGAIAGLVIALAPLLYFFPASIGWLTLCPDDGLIFNLPLRVTAAAMMRHGELPLWNPYIFGGMPLFASAQAGILFPLNWPFLFLSPAAAMNAAVLSSYSIAGIGAFLYARRSGSNVLGAIITAFVWQFSGFLVAQIGHTNVVHVACVLPWLLWAIDRFAENGARSRGVVVAALIAAQVFAGHPQTLAYSVIIAGAYVVYCFSDAVGPAKNAYILSAGMLAAGLCLAAVQLLPTWELMIHSVRSDTSYEFFSSFSLPPVFLLTYFAPFVVGGGDGMLFRAPYIGQPFYGEYIGYVGIAAVMLAGLAPFLRWDRTTKFWVCVALAGLGLALGRFWPFDLYRLVYYVPVLNLFRVPARHLMEVDLALAVLAGRAVAFLPQVESKRRRMLLVGVAAALVAACTCLAVTLWRPSDFHLGRVAPVSLLRAPELFVPLLMMSASICAVIVFASGRSGSASLLTAVMLADLATWGQFSSWRTHSARADDPIFREPETVALLRKRQRRRPGKYRILTLDQPFESALGQGRSRGPSGAFELELQPDVYMAHGIENLAGYDGFGLARQSRLAGEMKVWGDLIDPARSLTAGRELDLYNVRYVIARSRHSALSIKAQPTQTIGDSAFALTDLDLPFLKPGELVEFDTPVVAANRVAVLTSLAWSADVPDGTVAGILRFRDLRGNTFEQPLRVGIDSSEWAYDRPDIRQKIRHSRAGVGLSSRSGDGADSFEAHNYIASFRLPEGFSVSGGSIEVAPVADAPQFGVSLLRISFVNDESGETVPVRKEWLSGKIVAQTVAATTRERWSRFAQTGGAVIYRNRDALPRAWLATAAVVQPDAAKLAAAHTGKLPDGRDWDARGTVLLDDPSPVELPPTPAAHADVSITRYESNRVELKTACPSPSILVLADNYYPGWAATVDGAETKVLRADYNLRAVPLQAGQHSVRFAYRPKSLLYGLIISVLAAIGLTFWIRRGTGIADAKITA